MRCMNSIGINPLIRGGDSKRQVDCAYTLLAEYQSSNSRRGGGRPPAVGATHMNRVAMAGPQPWVERTPKACAQPTVTQQQPIEPHGGGRISAPNARKKKQALDFREFHLVDAVLPSPFHIIYNNTVCNCRTLTGAMPDIRLPWAALPAVADPRLRKITPCGRMPLRGFQAGSRYDMYLSNCTIGSIQNKHEKPIEDISILKFEAKR